jgi:Tol biopolymer transport system component
MSGYLPNLQKLVRNLALGMLLLCARWPLCAAPTRLISVIDAAQTAPAGGGGDSSLPIVSPDGRFVLFASTANNLVLATNGNPIPLIVPPRINVFLRDRTNGTTTLVSVNVNGVAGGNGDSIPADLSTNGRYAVFQSDASDLVPGDTNQVTDIFVRDLIAGTTTLVSTGLGGANASDSSRSPTMTPDGRYVAFVSMATNLVANDSNRIADVFVRDLLTGTTTLASVGATATNGTSAYPGTCEAPEITPDGRFVAFFSTATNLVPGVGGSGEIYVRDLVNSITSWASTNAKSALQAGLIATNAISYNHSISDDGQFVAFQTSPAPGSAKLTPGLIVRYSLQTGLTDLVHTNAPVAMTPSTEAHNLEMTSDGRFVAFVANTNGTAGTTTTIMVWDAQTGKATLASGDLGNRVPTNSICDWPSLDASGRFVAFLSSATNLVTNSLSGTYHLYVRDLQGGATVLVDADTNGFGSGVSPGTLPRLSANGQVVTFEAPDGNLVANDRNHDSDVFTRDLTAGATDLISAHHPGLASIAANGSTLPQVSVSAKGRFVAFASDADNLAPNDMNQCRDVFVRDLAIGSNVLVSVSTNGVSPGNGISSDPVISADGRFVAFTSQADNLVAGDNNRSQDVFVRDLATGTTTLVSINLSGTGPGSTNSYSPLISGDGRYVLFRSQAGNLVQGGLGTAIENFFWRDLQFVTTVALTTNSTSSTPGSIPLAMTLDGHFVAFADPASKFYVWDSYTAGRVYTNFTTSAVTSLALSPDGNRVVYVADSQLRAADRAAGTNWVIGPPPSASFSGLGFRSDGGAFVYAGITNSLYKTNQVYYYDFATGANLLISRDLTTQGASSHDSDSPAISPDGRFVAYRSFATNLVAESVNGQPNLYLCDRQTGTTTLLSVSRLGAMSGDNRSLRPVFSADGQTLLFQSSASDLLPGDYNHAGDIMGYTLFYAVILPGNLQSTAPWITWPLLPGRQYQVQSKNNPSALLWRDATGTITNDGLKGYFHGQSTIETQRIYRVLAY